MRPAGVRRAGFAVAVVVLSAGLPGAAHADMSPAPVLYVDKNNASCSDTGSGGADAPFCTVQAAADVVGPGQTVVIAPGAYPAVTMTRSGTSDAPIRFAPASPGPAFTTFGPVLLGLTISGASHIQIQSLRTPNPGVTVSGSNDVTLDSLRISGPLHITDTSSGVTVSRSVLPGVVIDGGSSGTVLTTNWIGGSSGGAAPLVHLADAPGTDITSNTITVGCAASALGLTDGSTGASIENNSVTVNDESATPCTTAQPTGLSVSADSATGTTADYNDLYSTAANPLYDWAGTVYTSPSAFHAATSQGAHDISASPQVLEDPACSRAVPTAGSPLVDSADSAAPGELSTDLFWADRVDDPLVADTGAGTGAHDRGAVERAFCLTADPGMTGANNTGLRQVKLTTSFAETWIAPTTQVVAWGDGTTTTRTQPGNTNPSFTHTYNKLGTYTITITISANGITRTMAKPFQTIGSGYHPLTSRQILDTRTGLGTAGAKTPVPPHGTLRLKVAGGTGLAATSASAVVLNITTVSPTTSGYIEAYTHGEVRPTASTLSFPKSGTVSGLAVVRPDAAGYVSLYNGSSGTTHLLADLEGYYALNSGSGYHPLTPTRLLDTRTTVRRVPAHGTVTLQLTGRHSIPSSQVTATALNITATDATASGGLTAYPGGTSRPGTSNLRIIAGRPVANAAIVPIAAQGTLTVYNDSSKPIDIMVDLDGYYSSGGGLAFQAVEPIRFTDVPVSAHTTHSSYYGWIADRYPVSAVDFNATVAAPTASGRLVAYPSGITRPGTSNTVFTRGQTVADLVQVGLGTDSSASVYNASSGTLRLILDAEGYFG